MTITVTAVNDAPVAANDAYSTAEDTPLAITTPGVLANDTDVDGGNLTAALAQGPANGAVNFGSNGGFVYTPNANFNGTDSFTYVANDGTAVSNLATVTINVTAVNDAPVAKDDSASTAYQTPVTIAVLANDTDVDSATLAAVLASPPANGSATCGATCTYTPNTGFSGTDSFTYRASDGSLLSNVATVTVDGGCPGEPAAGGRQRRLQHGPGRHPERCWPPACWPTTAILRGAP